MSNISLQNINNYKNKFDISINDIFSKYVIILSEYLLQITDVLYIKDNLYLKYVINKGIETVTHVFKILLLYTKNLEICYYYSQKAFYYYTEFIGQIVQIDEEHQSFLQLNCKDASLFVYKKTIFEINNDLKKNFYLKSDYTIKNIDLIINIYNNCVKSIINNFDSTSNDIKDIYKNVDNKLIKIISYLVNISLFDISNEELYDYYNTIYYFYNTINIDSYDKLLYLELFLKKNVKTKILLDKLKINLNNDYIKSNLYNENKYITLLFEQ